MALDDGKPLPDPMRHHTHHGFVHGRRRRPSMYAGGSSFMERMAEAVASGMGTVAFVLTGSAIILAWVFINGAAHYLSTTVSNIAKGGSTPSSGSSST